MQFMHESSRRQHEDEEGGGVDKEDVAWELVAEPPVLHDHKYDEERELGGDRHHHCDYTCAVEL